MKNIVIKMVLMLSLFFLSVKTNAQLHETPNCAHNFNLNWSTSMSGEFYWPPGQLSHTYNNVNGSETDITITFTGETSTLGFWSGSTPKVGSQSSYLYDGIDLLSNGFSGTGITCTITFSKPIYSFSFDIHHVNKWETNGDKYTFTGLDKDGNTIYPEFTNSPSPTYVSDNNTGVVNAISNITAGDNSIVGVNFSSPNHIKSVSFLWEDCDTCDHYLPHATGIGNFSFCTPQDLGFDGVDDYIGRTAFLGGKSETTMMSWVKLENNSDGGEIMGQRNFRLFIDSNKKLKAFIKTNQGSDIISPDLASESYLEEGLWHHTALTFDGNSGSATLYLNGNALWTYSDDSLIGTSIIETPEWNSDYDFEIGRNTEFENNYFEGSINECRVFSKALNLDQLQQQINQQIENNNGKIRGSIIPQDIEGLSWSDLIMYYKMGILNTGFTPDDANNGTDGTLHNMTINQDYTAPLPYATKISSNGIWTDPNNWLHGDVWNVTNNTNAYSIYKINGNISLTSNINTAGLIVEKDGVLSVKENSGLFNSWYLKLDGTLDLERESQLVQAENSILDETSSGILKKDLQGTADKYTYNYWSSPVGEQNDSTINNSYTLENIFTDVDFLTSGYDGTASPLSIADYWIWKYNNALNNNFSTWQHVRSTGKILAGEGFTMKGPGTGNIEDIQDYTLEGKPNNGDISLTVYAGNDYFVGNPYPSAIDAVKFIEDNKSTIAGLGSTNGTLYFWKHWGGGSHVSSDYQGGYATFSLSGGVPAASKNAESAVVSTGGTPIDIPNRYIPVGQGFYTTAETDGVITFKNSQRVFHIEDKSSQQKSGDNFENKVSQSEDTRMKLRMGFTSVNTLRRQLLITVDEKASVGYDWGYDSKYIDTQIDDMYWLINNEKYTIQGINEINEQSIIPLGIHTKTDGFNSIAIDELENMPDNLQIYLHDKELKIYRDLKQDKYETFLESGEYLNRFEITFAKPQTLGTEDFANQQIEVYFSNEHNNIVINNPSSKLIESIEMFNLLGQSLFKFQTNTNNNYLEYNASQISPSNYVLKIETESGIISKKVRVE
ncbi:LamG-like jellyroll fold domain-containing protein [Flavobacteriaceae bacterium SZ-1-7]|uniref:LamG-like jellyroll fold domain-containing protein n=1 Tax=Tamlana sedimenti TaxID=3134126 RepID=UPI0031225B0E